MAIPTPDVAHLVLVQAHLLLGHLKGRLDSPAVAGDPDQGRHVAGLGPPHEISPPLLRRSTGAPQHQGVALARVGRCGQDQALPVVPAFALTARSHTEPLPFPLSQCRIHAAPHTRAGRLGTLHAPALPAGRHNFGHPASPQCPRVTLGRITHGPSQLDTGGLSPNQQEPFLFPCSSWSRPGPPSPPVGHCPAGSVGDWDDRVSPTTPFLEN